jgi:hypothetical protein
MNISRMVLFSFIGAGVVAGCAPAAKAPVRTAVSAPVAARPAPANFPVIGYLQNRDQLVTIKAGPKGPLYSVKTAEGRVLFEDLSMEQLRAQAPDLHRMLKSGFAYAGLSSAMR